MQPLANIYSIFQSWRLETTVEVICPIAVCVHSLRARYGRTATANALHGSDSRIAAEREIAYFFPSLTRQSVSVSGEL